MGARRLFITGTDTGVGKTRVALALIAAARRLKVKVAAAKPLESGCSRAADGRLVPADAVWLRHAARMPEALELVCPYSLEKPLAPAYAAAEQKIVIDPRRILGALDRLGEDRELLIIEGAGGVLVPAWPGADMADLIRRCRAEALIVARPGLGTINHTRLTVEALQRRGIKIAGLVFNRCVAPAAVPIDESEKDNPRRIAELTGLPVWAVLPFAKAKAKPAAAQALRNSLAAWLGAGARGPVLEN